jgi:peptide/nickel transport system substrate-binding protein
MKTLIQFGLAVFIAIGGMLATAPSHAGKKDDTLNAILPRDVRTLDNMFSGRRENHIVSKNYEDMLFYIDPDDGEPKPMLVESYKIDGKTVDLKLKKGIKYHDGSELKAEDVAYSINYQASKEGKARRQKYFAYWVKKVDVTGPYSVRINMKREYPLVLYDLAMYNRIRQKGTFDDASKKDGLNRKATRTKVNGLGPYRVVSFEPRKKLVLERFDGYRKDSPKYNPASIKHITFRTVPDFGVQAAEVMAGGADWAYNVPPDVADDVQRSGRAQHITGPSMRVGFIILDAAGATGKDSPTTKLKVRQALNHAIDREDIVKNLVKGTGKVIHSACNPMQFGCAQDVKKYAYDPEKAKKLLAEAGYPDGFPVTLWSYRQKPVAEAIVGMMQKAGLKVQLRHVKGSQLRKAEKKNKVMMTFRTTGSGSISHAGRIVPPYFGGRSSRNKRYVKHDKELLKLVSKATSSHDLGVQKKYYKLALERVAEQAYWVPLYMFSLNYLASNDLEFKAPRDGMPRLFLAKWKK